MSPYKDGSYIIKDGIIWEVQYDLSKIWGAEVVNIPLPDFMKKTNAQMIRAMKDERLAEFLSKVACGCEYCDMKKECMYGSHADNVDDNCESAWLKWLKEEVRE